MSAAFCSDRALRMLSSPPPYQRRAAVSYLLSGPFRKRCQRIGVSFLTQANEAGLRSYDEPSGMIIKEGRPFEGQFRNAHRGPPRANESRLRLDIRIEGFDRQSSTTFLRASSRR